MLTETTLIALVEHQKLVERMRQGCLTNWQDLDLVFPRENGSPRSPQTDYDEWQKALKLCGIAPKMLLGIPFLLRNFFAPLIFEVWSFPEE